MIKIIKLYFKTISYLNADLASKQAFKLFQIPMNKKIRKKELPFFEEAEGFIVPWETEDLQCYQMGSADGPLVFLVHGWESSAASLYAIAKRLASDGYRVISFNLPAHGYSKLKRANLKLCKEAFLQVINYIQPSEEFSVVSHSFGSAVTTYALAKSTWRANQLIYLSTPDKIEEIFQEFSDFIGLNERAYQKVLDIGSHILGESVEEVSVSNFGKNISFNDLTIIHDENDRIIDLRKAQKVAQSWPNAYLAIIQDTGHYRMLWDEKVIDLVAQQLTNKKIEINPI